MRKLLLIASTLVLMPATAFAADLPSATAAQNSNLTAMEMASPSRVVDWTGAYVGLHVGGGRSSVDWTYTSNSSTADHNGAGVIGGVQAGYNYQVGQWVVGAEADISASGIEGKTDCPNAAWSCETSIDWLGTARLRLGYAVDRVLLYGTGGLAVGKVTANDHDKSPPTDYSQSATMTGWSAGAGVEYALGDGWSVKGEYMHADLGEHHFVLPSTTEPKVGYTVDVGTIGVNYRF